MSGSTHLHLLAKHLLWCGTAFVILSLCAHVTDATDVIRFDAQVRDSDDINDLLEDEQLFIVDKKSRHQPAKVTATMPWANASRPAPSHPATALPRSDGSPAKVTPYGDPLPARRGRRDAGVLSSSSSLPAGGTTLTSQQYVAMELEEDFLILSEEREAVSENEMAMEAERDRSLQRVRRSVVEGSGAYAVESVVEFNYIWNSNFSNVASSDFVSFEKSVTAALVRSLNDSLTPSVPVILNVWGFRESESPAGQTAILFQVDISNDTLSMRELGSALISLLTTGLNLNKEGSVVPGHYVVNKDPRLEDDLNNLKSARCYTCLEYQTCQSTDNENVTFQCKLQSSVLLPFGGTQGDAEITNAQNADTRIVEVTSPVPLAMGSNSYSNLYVSMKGLISFGERYNSFTPRRLPRSNRALFSGYWADMKKYPSDSRSHIWYQTYSKSDSSQSKSSAMLSQGKKLVELITGNRTVFDPTFMTLVTFEEMTPYQETPDHNTNERVSFQKAIITDGTSTYGAVLYPQGAMRWSEEMDRSVIIGFLDRNININKYRPDLVIGNTNMRGVWVWLLGTAPLTPEQECRNWYLRNQAQKNDYSRLAASLPQCPCHSVNAMQGNNFYQEFESSGQGSRKCFVTQPFFASHGSRCCYNPAFLTGGSDAGSFLLYHPLLNVSGNYLEDVIPHEKCCLESDLCYLFRELRPRGACQASRQLRIARGQGDPHIFTPDGDSFPFNGIGEFHLIKSTNLNMDINFQGRTCQAESSTGVPVQASVFCAFVLKANSSDKIEVYLSRNKSGMAIYINDDDVTTAFYANQSYRLDRPRLTVQRFDKTVRASFADGIELNVTTQFRLLTFGIALSPALVSVTGLLGNNNGNKSDDRLDPYGKPLINDTERAILAYGKTWSVNETTTLFRYPAGLNYTHYTNDSFMPIIMDELSAAELNDSKQKCGDDVGCIYDYLATKDEALALGTKAGNQYLATQVALMSNTAPKLSSNVTRINATVNQTVDILFVVDDKEDNSTGKPLNLTISTSTSLTFASVSNYHTYQYQPSAANRELQVFAMDSMGATSEVQRIEVVLCLGCSHHGVCNNDILRPQAAGASDLFKLATCICDPYYSGVDCENNYDACANEPCPVGTSCTDFTPEEHRAAGIASLGYNCTVCPAGYNGTRSADGVFKCVDVDECNVTRPCAQQCTNTQGSFTCACNAGYRLAANGRECSDLNECQLQTSKCQQNCINTAGGYNCSCNAGFIADGVNCTQNISYNPCDFDSSAKNCSYGCRNNNGSAQCYCAKGFKLDAKDNSTCIDVDECKDKSPCSQICTNSVGSYSCSCQRGFQLAADTVTCIECPSGRYGDCSQTCECTGRGTCDRWRGCVCDSGWSGVHCDIDTDECAVSNLTCPIGQSCLNSLGSYTCNCPRGFAKNANDSSKCDDINECGQPNLHDCTQVCTNTRGSYVCSCKAGYAYNTSSRACVDIDECRQDIDDCEQMCDNYVGGYTCSCNVGFVLNDDRMTCHKERDPCEMLSDSKNCSYSCQIVNGTAECYCQKGFTLAADFTSCVDINECSNSTVHLCTQTCANTQGNYLCTCAAGFVLANDMRTCLGCDSYHWGVNCSNQCDCNPVSTVTCDPVLGCVCKSGWLGTYCDIDRDDCQNSPCSPNALCTDVGGSYVCECNAGYYENSTSPQTCADVNECSSSPCDQTCSNTYGSFTCSCSSGFNRVNSSCEDINECLSNPCEQVCINTIGSYQCECSSSFVYSEATGKCEPRTACQANNCSYGCVWNNTNQCFCEKGYELSNLTLCIDINECAQSPCINGSCTNKNGSFDCSCSPGTRLLEDHVTCEVCPSGTFGNNCSSNCTCNSANTLSCDPVNGACHCTVGYIGTDCSQDINECTNNLHNCGNVSNSQCVNTNGSFYCKCDSGFSKSGGLCYPCDDTAWGDQCSQPCTCNRTNTASCDDRNGTCYCKSEWTGSDCNVDVNECNATANCSGVQERCLNLVGGYRCDCNTGYERPSPTESCSDINECLYINLNTCDAVKEECVNTAGGFTCRCKATYNGTAGNCTDLDECLVNNPCNITTESCNNTAGGYRCDCRAGYQRQSPGVSCTDINECNTTLHTCDTVKENCVNTAGGFTCQCKATYNGTAGNCTDIDECSNNPCNITTESCNNTVRGYRCDCRIGYQRLSSNSSCTDINECNTTLHTCDTVKEDCVNTAGGFTCQCKATYNGTVGNCTDLDECLVNNPCNITTESCNNTVGGYRCDCRAGYQRLSSNSSCTEVNVCNSSSNTCDAVKEKCVNIPGSFTCQCRAGYSGTAGNCTEQDGGINSTLTLEDYVPTENLINPATAYYRDLLILIRDALEVFFRGRIGEAFLGVRIKSMKQGSVIVDYEIVLTNNSDAWSKAATSLNNLLQQNSLTVNGTSSSISNMTVSGKPVGVTSDACSIYTIREPCKSGQECTNSSGLPICANIQSSESDYRLVIGLGVGIPLFVIFCIIVGILIYIYIKRRKHVADPSQRDPSDRFPSIFAGQVPTKGSWGAAHRYQMYSPDNMSVSHTSDSSGDGQLLKGRRAGFNSYDSPWYSAAGGGATPYSSRPQQPTGDVSGPGALAEEAPGSNFSWEYMFQLLAPFRGLEIQRPRVDIDPNPAFTSRSSEPRPDSLA